MSLFSLGKSSILLVYLILHTVFALSGCATLSSQRAGFLSERPTEHIGFFKQLDEAVDNSRVRDAAHRLVSGFPYLRTNRFFTHLGRNLKTEQERQTWVRLMRQLDLKARAKEIRNLTDEAVIALGGAKEGKLDREGLAERAEFHSEQLLRHDHAQTGFYESLYPSVKVPTEYSLSMRVLGFYPLFSIPVIIGTNKAHKEFNAWYKEDLDKLPVLGSLTTFGPPSAEMLSASEIQMLLSRSTTNPLGVPLLDESDEKNLVASLAPSIMQDIAQSYDRFGEVTWSNNRLVIDEKKPTVYYYISHGLRKGKPILQVNYAVWYSERAGENAPWIERGALDGLTIRISLDYEGRMFMVDLMNTCGCYHVFIPEKQALDHVVAKRLKLDPFVPQWLPEVPPGERLGIRVMSGWHQVERVFAHEPLQDRIFYDLVPYDLLESLPRADGSYQSMFDEDGIVKGSNRTREEVLFFSMGIPSVASMRQRGRHAIALVGRDYFDDPQLFDKNFVFK